MEWFKGKESSKTEAGGEFEQAAARVTAEAEVEAGRVAGPEELAAGEDRLEIRTEWAEAASRACFFPAARLWHSAYALTDEEAEVISPKMQAFLQAVADKYAPAAIGRVASKYPEFFDLTAALGVLYWQKWRFVTKMRALDAAERAQKEADKKPATPETIDIPVRPKVGERTEDGALVI